MPRYKLNKKIENWGEFYKVQNQEEEEEEKKRIFARHLADAVRIKAKHKNTLEHLKENKSSINQSNPNKISNITGAEIESGYLSQIDANNIEGGVDGIDINISLESLRGLDPIDAKNAVRDFNNRILQGLKDDKDKSQSLEKEKKNSDRTSISIRRGFSQSSGGFGY